MDEGGSRKLGLREDWASVPFLTITMVGFIISIYDFWILQVFNFRLNAPRVVGILLLASGGYLRITSRRALTRAGFGLLNSSRLQIVDGNKLITNGVTVTSAIHCISGRSLGTSA
jgi:hypothetical protein